MAPAVDVVDTDTGFAALRRDWTLLLPDSADRSPFLSWEYADAWWRSFGGRDRLHVVVVRDGREVLAIAPLLRCGGLAGRVPAVYIGIGHEAADYCGALLGCRPEVTGPLLFGHLDRLVRTGGTVVLGRLDPDGDLLPMLSRHATGSRASRLTALFSEEYPYLDLAALDDPQRAISRAWKKNDVRRRLRRLSAEHEVAFVHHRSPKSDPQALADFFALHDARWAQKQAVTGARAAGLFATAAGRRFLREAAAGLDDAGWLRLSFVNVDGRPFTGRFGLEYDGRYFGLKSAFDPAMSDHGPGHMITGFLLQQAVDDGLQRFDFMRGAGAHKHNWTTTSRPVGYHVLHRRGRCGDLQRRYAWATLRWRNHRRFA